MNLPPRRLPEQSIRPLRRRPPALRPRPTSSRHASAVSSRSASRWAIELEPDGARNAKEWTLFWLSIGAIVGTMIAIAVLFFFLGRVRMTLIVTLAIPLSLLERADQVIEQ
mgnify:CR=1 FL=1